MKDLTKLLEQLAAKLGTTAEYLWAVLLKQAKVSATIDLIYLILSIVSGILLYRLHKKLSKQDGGKNSIYYEYEEAATVPMAIAAMIWGLFFLFTFFSIGDIINGYFNPEYWALEKVLDKIGD